MKKARRTFSWLLRPQALIGFAVVCLGLSGLGLLGRPVGSGTDSVATATPSFPPSATSSINCNVKPCVALTFDDGPQPQVTPQVLNILARHQIKSTFFVIGVHVPGNEALLQR